eukprot:scpid75713/ scgid6441/ 
MSVILTAVNNAAGVTDGLYTPHFTLGIREFDSRNKTISLEGAQFELHRDNITSRTKKIRIEIVDTPGQSKKPRQRDHTLVLLTGTYETAEQLRDMLNARLNQRSLNNVTFSYSRATGKFSLAMNAGVRVVFDSNSPNQVLGIGNLGKGEYTIQAPGSEFPYPVDLSDGVRQVLLYTDSIPHSIEYENNTDSRLLKAFPIITQHGVNNYVFSNADERIMLPYENLNSISFWLKYNTGEYISTGFPIYLDMRIRPIK